MPSAVAKDKRATGSPLMRRDDLFLQPLLADIKQIDRDLQERVSSTHSDALSRTERFRLVKDDIQKLIAYAGDAARLTGYGMYGPYDEVASMAGKWAAYAAYCGSPISVESLADPQQTASAQEIKEKHQPKIVGQVIKTAMQKTVTVLVTRFVKDPIYGKRVRRSKKYLVHDEYNQCNVGDIIIAFSSRPLSKRKSHSFVSKIRSAPHTLPARPEPQSDIIPYSPGNRDDAAKDDGF